MCLRPFPLYWPPEMLEDPNLPWDGAAEIFSFALVVMEIFKELDQKADLWLNFCDYAEQGTTLCPTPFTCYDRAVSILRDADWP